MEKEELIKEQLEKVKRMLFKANFLTNEVMSGEYSSAFRGQGLEFNEVREYVPGDDVRLIDWNVTARTGTPYIKSFNEEREISVMIVVDASSSMFFGSGGDGRLERASALAAFIGYNAIKNHDKVGLLIFSDTVEKYIPHKKGKSHLWHIINELIRFEPTGKSSNLNIALEYLLKVVRKKTIVFMISDFYLKDFEQSMRIASKRHDLIAIRLKEEFEEAMPDAGILELKDFETGKTVVVDAGNKKTAEVIAANLAKQKSDLTGLFNRLKIDLMELGTADDVSQKFLQLFKKREKKFLKFH